MSLPVVLRAEAEEDVRSIFGELREIGLNVAQNFQAKLRECFELMELSPECSGRIWKDIRARRVNKYRYVVYYVVRSDCVEVLAVIHGARSPRVWRRRAH